LEEKDSWLEINNTITIVDDFIMFLDSESERFKESSLQSVITDIYGRARNLKARLNRLRNIIAHSSSALKLFNKLFDNKEISSFNSEIFRFLSLDFGEGKSSGSYLKDASITIYHFENYIDVVSNEIEQQEKNQKRLTNSLSNIEYNLKESKSLVDKIRIGYEDISNSLIKAKEQREELDKFEQTLRKSIIQMEVDRGQYNEKNSVINKSFEIASEFLKKYNEFETKYYSLSENYNNLNVTISKLEERFDGIDGTLVEKINEIEKTITKANEALGMTTSVALGGHFKKQYEDSKKHVWIWPAAAAFFLSGAILLCIYAVFPLNGDNKTAELPYILSRLFIAPLFLIGAWFCSGQYIKQKNIIEDYAHKKVLSLSLLSIKSEVETTGEANTAEFIKVLQGEIMRSPLDSLDRKYIRNETKFLKKTHSELIKSLVKTLSDKKKSKTAK